jgi:hypothetical protein
MTGEFNEGSETPTGADDVSRGGTVPAVRRLFSVPDDDPADDSEGGNEPAELDTPLTPEARAKRGARGIPAVMGDGEEWLLFQDSLSPELDGYRDRLFDSSTLTKKVGMDDVREVAWFLLKLNYSLTGEEAASLVVNAGQKGLAEAVMDALLWPDGEHKTYTTWVRSSLLTNGLVPESIPPEILPSVLLQLVQTGRAVPADEFISSAVAAGKRRKLMDKLRG